MIILGLILLVLVRDQDCPTRTPFSIRLPRSSSMLRQYSKARCRTGRSPHDCDTLVLAGFVGLPQEGIHSTSAKRAGWSSPGNFVGGATWPRQA